MRNPCYMELVIQSVVHGFVTGRQVEDYCSHLHILTAKLYGEHTTTCPVKVARVLYKHPQRLYRLTGAHTFSSDYNMTLRNSCQIHVSYFLKAKNRDT
jgi:hypothetical protein